MKTFKHLSIIALSTCFASTMSKTQMAPVLVHAEDVYETATRAEKAGDIHAVDHAIVELIRLKKLSHSAHEYEYIKRRIKDLDREEREDVRSARIKAGKPGPNDAHAQIIYERGMRAARQGDVHAIDHAIVQLRRHMARHRMLGNPPEERRKIKEYIKALEREDENDRKVAKIKKGIR